MTCVSTQNIPVGSLEQPFDAFIVLNGPAEIGVRLRPHDLSGARRWSSGLSMRPTSPRCSRLHQPEVRQGWDAIVVRLAVASHNR